MNFTIPSKVFYEIATCCNREDLGDEPDMRLCLSGVLIERTVGLHLIVTGSNGKILGCRHLGYNVDDVPERVLVRPTKKLLQACLAGTSLMITNGVVMIADVNGIPIEVYDWSEIIMTDEYLDWLGIIRKRQADYGDAIPLSFDGRLLGRLARSAPSGFLYFQRDIFEKSPIIVGDTESVDWFGALMPIVDDTETNRPAWKVPATLPDWI